VRQFIEPRWPVIADSHPNRSARSQAGRLVFAFSTRRVIALAHEIGGILFRSVLHWLAVKGTPFMNATPEMVRDLNTLAEFLALEDVSRLAARELAEVCGAVPVDCLVLLGNALLPVAERAFRAMEDGLARVLVISGGVGHATGYLREFVSRHPRYHHLKTAHLSEAEILGQIAIGEARLDPDRVILENRSTNCGENASYTRLELSRHGLRPRTLLLMQDPTMQRRSDATFRQVFGNRRGFILVNHPTFVPKVTQVDGEIRFLHAHPQHLWPVDYFVALVLGEIPRLRDDERGYGPKGKGYITHVDLPPSVERAHARLEAALGKGRGGLARRSIE